MGGADVLTTGDQVFHAFGDQGPERDLKGDAGQINIIVPAGTGMQVEMIVPYPYRIGIGLRQDPLP